MGRMSHRNQERTERRISAAASLMLCALTVLAQIAVTLLLTRFLKEKASFVYGFLQLIGAVVAIRVYQRSGSPSYTLSWMCLLLILPVAGMLLFCLWGGTHQAKQLSLKPVPPIPHLLNISAPLHIDSQGAKSLPPQERQGRSQIVGRDPHHIGAAQIRQVTGRPKELATDPCTVQRSLHPLRIRHGAGKDQIIFHTCSSFSSLFLRREHTGLTSGMAA